MSKKNYDPNINFIQISLMDYIRIKEDFCKLFAENTRGHFKEDIISDSYIMTKCDELECYLDKNSAYVIGAFYCEKLIGFIWAHPKLFAEEKRMYIYSLIISNDFRGQKLGQALVVKIEEIALKIGIRVIDVSTAVFKTKAIDFYKKLGYDEERIYLIKKLNPQGIG